MSVDIGNRPEHVTSLSDALSRIAASFAADIPDDALLGDIMRCAIEVAGCELGLLRAVSADGGNFVVHSAIGPEALPVAGMIGAYSVINDELRRARAGAVYAWNLQSDDPSPLLSANERWALQQLGIQHLTVIPLSCGGELVGRLDLARTYAEPFHPAQIKHAAVIGAQAAVALNQRRLRGAYDESQIFRAVMGLHQTIEQLADPRTILQAVVELILREPGCDRCYAMLWNAERGEFVPSATAGLQPHLVEMLKLITLSPQVVPAFDRMIHSSRPLVVDDAAASTLLPSSLVAALGTRAAMIVPLRGRRQRTLGFLLLDYTAEGMHFDDRQISVMEGIAQHLSTMIENAILYEEAVSSSDTLSVINEIGIQLAMLSDEMSLFRQLQRQVAAVVDASSFAVGLLSADHRGVEVWQAADGQALDASTTIALGQDSLSRAIATGRSSLSGVRDPNDADNWSTTFIGADAAHSRMTVPITVGRNVIGAMSVQSPYRYAYGPKDLTLFTAIALHTGVAFENARLYRLVQERGQRRAVVLDELIQRSEVERKELVDDIHNNTLQTLAACLFRLDRVGNLVGQPARSGDLEHELDTVREQLATNIDRLRERIFRLRPATFDVLGLEPALRELLAGIELEQHISTALEVALPGRLDPEQETLVYRIIQEALSLGQMVGAGQSVALRVLGSADGVKILLHNAATGPLATDTLVEPGADGEVDIAVLALIERAELAGGAVRMRTTPRGATLQVSLPEATLRNIRRPALDLLERLPEDPARAPGDPVPQAAGAAAHTPEVA